MTHGRRGWGGIEHILEHFQDLEARGPSRGYFPGPTKRILVVSPRNVARAEELFRRMGTNIINVIQYLGGFVGDRADEDS